MTVCCSWSPRNHKFSGSKFPPEDLVEDLPFRNNKSIFNTSGDCLIFNQMENTVHHSRIIGVNSNVPVTGNFVNAVCSENLQDPPLNNAMMNHNHQKGNVVIFIKFLSLAATKVVILTNSCAASVMKISSKWQHSYPISYISYQKVWVAAKFQSCTVRHITILANKGTTILLRSYPISKLHHCNSFEDQSPVDENIGPNIQMSRLEETTWQVTRIVAPTMAALDMPHCTALKLVITVTADFLESKGALSWADDTELTL